MSSRPGVALAHTTEAGETFSFQSIWFKEGWGQEWKGKSPMNDALRLGGAAVLVCRWEATP